LTRSSFVFSRELSLFYSTPTSLMSSRPTRPSRRPLLRSSADSTPDLLWPPVASPRLTSPLEARCVLGSFVRSVRSLLTFSTISQLIRAGDGIIASNQSANRDEEVFPDPDTFNMHRKRGSEEALGYGYGAHRCVAEWLARAELETVFGESPLLPCFQTGMQMTELLVSRSTLQLLCSRSYPT
jgi:hypothetical protein